MKDVFGPYDNWWGCHIGRIDWYCAYWESVGFPREGKCTVTSFWLQGQEHIPCTGDGTLFKALWRHWQLLTCQEELLTWWRSLTLAWTVQFREAACCRCSTLHAAQRMDRWLLRRKCWLLLAETLSVVSKIMDNEQRGNNCFVAGPLSLVSELWETNGIT